MKRLVGFLLTFAMFHAEASQAAIQPGQLLLLEDCPGDEKAEIKATSNEALLEALLTPLITGVVNSGLKLAGEKLKEASQEAQVDVLHTGAHFYEWRKSANDKEPGYWDLASWCLIVASKQAKSTKTTLQDLVKGYEGYTVAVAEDGARSLKSRGNRETDLIDALKPAGFEGRATPGLLAVLDVELSAQRSEFRLVPRFVVMDHSIREKKTDKYQRDMTLEFSFAVASSADAFAKGLLKLEGLSIGSAKTQKPGHAHQASHWMPLPALNDNEKARMDAARALRAQQATHKQAAKLAGAAAVALDANEWKDSDGNLWRPVLPESECPALAAIARDLLKSHALLQAEQVKPAKDPAVVARWTNVVTYFDSCNKSRKAQEALSASATKAGALARSFDATIAIKEFRKRPVAKFFGEILADDTTREELTTAIVGAVDPATKEAAAKAEAKTRLALMKAYEEAVLKAQNSMIAYDSAKEEEKAAKLLQMHYDQRTANRAAEALGIALPYPEAGTWVGL